MAVIFMTEAALSDADRLFEFLAAAAPDAAARAGTALEASISRLERFPESVPVIGGEIRIMTVPFGKRGYSVAYVYETEADTVIVLGIKHQTEEFFPFELEESAEE